MPHRHCPGGLPWTCSRRVHGLQEDVHYKLQLRLADPRRLRQMAGECILFLAVLSLDKVNKIYNFNNPRSQAC